MPSGRNPPQASAEHSGAPCGNALLRNENRIKDDRPARAKTSQIHPIHPTHPTHLFGPASPIRPLRCMPALRNKPTQNCRTKTAIPGRASAQSCGAQKRVSAWPCGVFCRDLGGISPRRHLDFLRFLLATETPFLVKVVFKIFQNHFN